MFVNAPEYDIQHAPELEACTWFTTDRTGLNRDFRKELMYMLHIRRKAEIEILSTIKPVDLVGDSGQLLDR